MFGMSMSEFFLSLLFLIVVIYGFFAGLFWLYRKIARR